MDRIGQAGSATARAGLILLFLAVGLLVFSVYFGGAFALRMTRGLPLDFSQQGAVIRGLQGLVALGCLIAALALRKSTRLRPTWRLAFAYFAALASLILSDYTGDWALSLSGQAVSTARGFTALKLGEDAAIIGTIVFLALLTRDDLRELYLSKGRLGLGLAIGITSLVVLTVLGISPTFARRIRPERVRELLPAFLLVVLADGFMEELLFRGLFLRRLGRFVGPHWANGVTATVFAVVHLGVLFTASLPTFVVTVFLLGLVCGWMMQRTESLLAPALFHAGVDMLIISDAFSAFGIGG